MDQLILVLELVGTLAFAASGAMTALPFVKSKCTKKQKYFL